MLWPHVMAACYGRRALARHPALRGGGRWSLMSIIHGGHTFRRACLPHLTGHGLTMRHLGHTLRLSRIFLGPFATLALVAGISTMAQAQQTQAQQTRFGPVAISKDRITWRGHAVHPVLTGNSGLMLSPPIAMGDSDIVVVQSIGGSLCPATFAVLQVSRKKEQHTNFFGTCSDIVHTKVVGDTLQLRMPSMHTNGVQRTYTYHDGLVSKEGVLLNSPCTKGICENYFGDE